MPKVVDHAQRRQEVVAATWAVIADEGIEAATVRRIAEAAGCTTGRITHYFDAKDDILVAALRAVHLAAAERMAAAIRAGDHGDPVGVLRSVVDEALPLDAARRTEWRVWLAFWGRAASERTLRREQAQRYAEWRLLLTSLLEGVMPGAAPDDVAAKVDLVAAAIDGLGMQAVLEPRRFTRRRLGAAVDQLVASTLGL
jgi:TetR/AcrR family transcriptional repressor of bet genes